MVPSRVEYLSIAWLELLSRVPRYDWSKFVCECAIQFSDICAIILTAENFATG